MKNLKIIFVLVVICATLITGCENDDENTSSPGYFILEGEKNDLVKAYFRCLEVENNGVACFQNEVYFLSYEIENEETSNRFTVLFECLSPLEQNSGIGEYTYLSDNAPLTPYTYFGFLYNQRIGTAESKDFWLRETVHVKKSGDVYEYSSSGKTSEGKAFEFYYKGTLAPIPED